MQVTVELPDEIINAKTEEASRQIFERFALEGYRSGQLTTTQVRRILGFKTRLEVYDFLAAHGIAWVDYSEAEAQRERELLKRVLPE